MKHETPMTNCGSGPPPPTSRKRPQSEWKEALTHRTGRPSTCARYPKAIPPRSRAHRAARVSGHARSCSSGVYVRFEAITGAVRVAGDSVVIVKPQPVVDAVGHGVHRDVERSND